MNKDSIWKPPDVRPGDWVRIGESSALDAVVSCVRATPGSIEVVYLDRRNRAINEDVVWDDGTWRFEQEGPSGGYADGYTRLREYVYVLRQGRRA